MSAIAMETETFTPGRRRLSLLAVNLCVLGVGVGFGALVPLMALAWPIAASMPR